MHEIDLDKPAPEHAIEVVTQSYAVPERIETHLSPLDVAPEVFKAGLDRRRQNHRALVQWVRAAMVEDVDFGKIHVVKKSECSKGKWCMNMAHFSKPSLFKPGAEKINAMLGVTPHFPTIKDYEQAAVSGVAVETIILRCELKDSYGNVVAEGVGARLVSKDYGDINKSLKMAEKSGQIDATLRLAGLSEVFTQDIEDMVAIEEIVSPGPPQEPSGSVEGVASGSRSPAPARAPVSPETQELLDQAKANREAAAASITSTPEGRQRVRDAGFPCREPDEDRTEKCKKCGGDMGPSRDGTTIQCIDGKKEWFDLQRAGKTASEASAMTKGHSFRKVKK